MHLCAIHYLVCLRVICTMIR